MIHKTFTARGDDTLQDNQDAPTRARGGCGEDRRARIAHRAGPFTPEQRTAAQDTFLEALCRCGNITLACRAAGGLSRNTVWAWKERDGAFAVRYHHALEEAADLLEAEAWRRAVQGVEQVVVSGGKVVYHDGQPLIERQYSDRLLIHLLRAHHPRYQAQPTLRLEGTGRDSGPIAVSNVKRLLAAKLDDLARRAAQDDVQDDDDIGEP